MSNLVTRQPLTASPNGQQIVVTGTVAPGVTIHQPPGFPSIVDEIWLYACNNGTNPTTLTTLWGGTNATDANPIFMAGTGGRVLIADGQILQNPRWPVSAYVSTGTIFLDGFVNRIDSGIDPRIIDWAARVVVNGGPMPSLSTQQALSIFMRDMSRTGVLPKIISMIPLVPDSVIAATTPLLPSKTFDPWTNNGFVSGDLNINGMVGNGSSKYLNTGVIPVNTAMTSTSAGLTAYVWDNSAASSGYSIGCGGAANSSHFNLFPSDTAGTTTDAFCWRFVNVGTDWVSGSKPTPSGGYYSFSRTASNLLSFYFGNSVKGHVTLGTATGAQTGGVINDQPVFAFVTNANGAPAAYSVNRISFLAMHVGLTTADSLNFFNAIQALRINLGGGYI